MVKPKVKIRLKVYRSRARDLQRKEACCYPIGPIREIATQSCEFFVSRFKNDPDDILGLTRWIRYKLIKELVTLLYPVFLLSK
jgi:hypothetical protein